MYAVAPFYPAAVVLPSSLQISIVTYQPDLALLERTLDTLGIAIEAAQDARVLNTVHVALIDNSERSRHRRARDRARPQPASPTTAVHVMFLHGHANIGYGAAHNLVLHGTGADYHLVLNPDVELDGRCARQCRPLARRASGGRRARARCRRRRRQPPIPVQALPGGGRPGAARICAAVRAASVSRAVSRATKCATSSTSSRRATRSACRSCRAHSCSRGATRSIARAASTRASSSTSRTSTGACGSTQWLAMRSCRVSASCTMAAARRARAAPHRLVRRQRTQVLHEARLEVDVTAIGDAPSTGAERLHRHAPFAGG